MKIAQFRWRLGYFNNFIGRCELWLGYGLDGKHRYGQGRERWGRRRDVLSNELGIHFIVFAGDEYETPRSVAEN